MLLVWLVSGFSRQLYEQSTAADSSRTDLSSDAFREMKVEVPYLELLQKLCEKNKTAPSEFLTPLMTLGRFHIPAGALQFTWSDYENLNYLFLRYNRSGYEKLKSAYEAVWDDVKCFPLSEPGITYENSWMFERTYGGKRGHEGVDLMPPRNLPGHYKVLSMTDGVVEKIGWLEMGGYRIGIRSPSGGYFYYAHLDSYARDFKVGEQVGAGEVLGTMGDTGYGPEGTRGRFDVHLHLGIYISTDQEQEISVNPYWVLRYTH